MSIPRNRRYIITFIVLFFTFFLQCKKTKKESKLNDKTLVAENNISLLGFKYSELVGKTFLPVNKEADGTYKYYGDISVEFDMGESRIRFKEKKIKHLIPIEWQSYHILKKENKDQWLKLNLVGNLEDVNEKRAHFSYFFKYDKNKNLLFHSRHLDSNHLEVFMDSAFIAEKESKNSKKKSTYKQNLIYKSNSIIHDSKEINIKIPFIKKHLNNNGQEVFNKNDLMNSIEVFTISTNKGYIYYLTQESNLSLNGFYNSDGVLLFCNYVSLTSSSTGDVLIKIGDYEKMLSDYNITDDDIGNQLMNVEKAIHTIKNWY